MSDYDKQRIDDLEKKLLDLHEKYDEAKEAKALAEKAQAAAEAKAKSKWFSREMIGVYMAVLGGIAAWGENLMNRLTTEYQKKQAAEQEQKIDNRVGEGLVKYVDYRIDEVTDVCGLYLDAVMEGMPSYQRTKVERYLTTAESDAGSSKVTNTVESLLNDNPKPSPSVSDKSMEKTRINPISASSSVKDESPFQMILQQAKKGEELDLEEVIKKSKHKVKLNK